MRSHVMTPCLPQSKIETCDSAPKLDPINIAASIRAKGDLSETGRAGAIVAGADQLSH
jgi:hypothetical protein